MTCIMQYNNTIIRYKLIKNLHKEDLQLLLDVFVLTMKFNIKACLYMIFFLKGCNLNI